MNGELANPMLADLEFLVGDWDMTLSNTSFLDDPNQVLSGRTEIRPIESGMLLAMRQVGEAGGPSLASWLIGRDVSGDEYTVLYTDDRPASRVYAMTFDDSELRIWRDDPDFSQRFSARASIDRRLLEGRWEKRTSAGPWEHDFDVAYSRR
jgi:hypothetical protein